VCTDHEELYKNILKPRIKVGNDFVTQVSRNVQWTTFNATAQIIPDVQESSFRLQI